MTRPIEPYAWPGGYPTVAIMDDGELLCAACHNDPSNPVHRGGDADGWRVDGYGVLEGSAEDHGGAVYCAHCWSVLVEDETAFTGEATL